MKASKIKDGDVCTAIVDRDDENRLIRWSEGEQFKIISFDKERKIVHIVSLSNITYMFGVNLTDFKKSFD